MKESLKDNGGEILYGETFRALSESEIHAIQESLTKADPDMKEFQEVFAKDITVEGDQYTVTLAIPAKDEIDNGTALLSETNIEIALREDEGELKKTLISSPLLLGVDPRKGNIGTFKFTAQLNGQKRHIISSIGEEDQFGYIVVNPDVPDRQYVGLFIPSHKLQSLFLAVSTQ